MPIVVETIGGSLGFLAIMAKQSQKSPIKAMSGQRTAIAATSSNDKENIGPPCGQLFGSKRRIKSRIAGTEHRM
jgi:hypothetical protein